MVVHDHGGGGWEKEELYTEYISQQGTRDSILE